MSGAKVTVEKVILKRSSMILAFQNNRWPAIRIEVGSAPEMTPVAQSKLRGEIAVRIWRRKMSVPPRNNFMNTTLLIYLAIGVLIGAAIGFLHHRGVKIPRLPHFKPSDGAFGGAVAGLMVFMLFGASGASSAQMKASTQYVKSITQDHFNAEVLESSTPVLVDFFATWCGPCKMMSPRVDQVAEDLHQQIKFVKIDVDQAPAIAQQFQIDGIPALLLFKDGKVVKSMVGLQSEAELEASLKSSEQ